jgi:hypothetical protein
MILLFAVLIGLLLGALFTWRQKRPYSLPLLRAPWLVVAAFIPQVFAFYLPLTRSQMPDGWVSVCLVSSQIMMLVFAWLNRRLNGMGALICGLGMNLAVILANGGLMPISPQTAARLLPAEIVNSLEVGQRFGAGKDILLLAEQTSLVWLSDRFLLPAWISHQVAFSLGDVFIALGIIHFLAIPGTIPNYFIRIKHHVTNPCNQNSSLSGGNPNPRQ